MLRAFAVVACLAPVPAIANCIHNGVTYSVGARICAGGWLQECTTAGYWKAVGYCRSNDLDTPLVLSSIPDSEAADAGKKTESIVVSVE